MEMNDLKFRKLTTAYLNRFFADKNLPYETWDFIINGVSYNVSNLHVIDSILKAPPEQQRMIADALFDLEESNKDVNGFLKNLALQGYELEK